MLVQWPCRDLCFLREWTVRPNPDITTAKMTWIYDPTASQNPTWKRTAILFTYHLKLHSCPLPSLLKSTYVYQVIRKVISHSDIIITLRTQFTFTNFALGQVPKAQRIRLFHMTANIGRAKHKDSKLSRTGTGECFFYTKREVQKPRKWQRDSGEHYPQHSLQRDVWAQEEDNCNWCTLPDF